MGGEKMECAGPEEEGAAAVGVIGSGACAEGLMRGAEICSLIQIRSSSIEPAQSFTCGHTGWVRAGQEGHGEVWPMCAGSAKHSNKNIARVCTLPSGVLDPKKAPGNKRKRYFRRD
jgi:hypothetical protein